MNACYSSDGLLLNYVSGSKASIFVRKTLSVRLRDREMRSISKLAGKDRRFSMNMMFAQDPEIPLQPSELSRTLTVPSWQDVLQEMCSEFLGSPR